ncbi:hypothetical protein LUZ60_010037 [Juncus effusus]|nr:hypothetical protein LUZ60_010037 [Juncus effusus]
MASESLPPPYASNSLCWPRCRSASPAQKMAKPQLEKLVRAQEGFSHVAFVFEGQLKKARSHISTTVIVGAAVGGLVVLIVLILCLLCCCKKKKRRYDVGVPMHYDRHPPPSEHQSKQDKENSNGGKYKHLQQSAPQSNHKVTKVKFSSDPHPPPATSPLFNSGGSASNSSTGDNSHPPMNRLDSTKGTFSYEELFLATDGFADSNLLGQGGFGYVHKGVLPNGKEIAVKKLKSGSGQGVREFQAEVDIISRVHHKHLVSLVGYFISNEHMLLVYEFVPNDTLEFHLHGKGRPTMEWPTRMKIALGAAKGLAYIHEDCHPKIIHRDIKASNILLDDKFEAKVADFGLAKFTSDNNTHISTRVMGTFGYLAPEYASSGKLSDKSDVFSFGVMLLELITGRRPVDTSPIMDDSLVDWARPLLLQALEEGNYEQLVDPRLDNNLNPNEVARMIACAAACVRHSAKRRPRMSQVVRALEGDVSLENLNEGIKPGQSQFFGSYTSSDYDSRHYNEDMKKFRNMVLQSGETQSSQYSAPTSEYAQNQSGSSSETHTHEMEMGKMKNKDGYQFGSQGY